MKNNKTIFLSTILCFLPMILSIMLYDQLPKQVAIHFDSSGIPNNYVPKAYAAFGLPILLAILNLYHNFRITNDPKIEHASLSMRKFSVWLVPIISNVIIPFTLFIALGRKFPIVMVAGAIAGSVIVICGNYLPKCKQNYSIGIRLPWTLNDEENWNHTHRFAGIVWVIGGIVIVINAFLKITYVNIIIIVLLVLLPITYSFFYFRTKSNQ